MQLLQAIGQSINDMSWDTVQNLFIVMLIWRVIGLDRKANSKMKDD